MRECVRVRLGVKQLERDKEREKWKIDASPPENSTPNYFYLFELVRQNLSKFIAKLITLTTCPQLARKIIRPLFFSGRMSLGRVTFGATPLCRFTKILTELRNGYDL